MKPIQLTYDSGTAYDLFVSLWVLHHPARFGLRPSWAAGVRSRLPAELRAFLEAAQSFLPVPIAWLFGLAAEEKTAAAALQALEALNVDARLRALTIFSDTPPAVISCLEDIRRLGRWQPSQLEQISQAIHFSGAPLPPAMAEALCAAWAQGEDWTNRYLEALHSYCQVFFDEEEQRIGPKLMASLAQAQRQATDTPLPDLLEQLSNGVKFESLQEMEEITLVACYWASPLVFYNPVTPTHLVFLFGARPEKEPIVPGEKVSPALVSSLKALADPTRLRILRYLAVEPLTPGELARRLRLRPPTVTHHLTSLRLAGLVQVILQAEGEKRYALRREAVERCTGDLVAYLVSIE